METKEIHSILDSYQTGTAQPEDDTRIEVGGTALEQQAAAQEETVPPSFYQRMRQGIRMNPTVSEDYTEPALASGFGTSRYDSAFTPATDIEHNRALGQSWFAKVGTGLAKGGVTALSTLINSTAGVLCGLGSGIYELAADANGNGRSFMDTMDATVNNWVSEQTVKLQNWSEEFLPNYRTQEERTDKYQKEWWKHIGTGNFIGDSILKNFGFTVGAMGGGAVWSKGISKVMGRLYAGNIMKGVVAAAEGDAEATAELTRALEAIKRGTVVGVNADRLTGNALKAARRLNSANARLQLYGSAIAAMGEGTVEGLMAKDEFLQEQNAWIEQQFADEYAGAEQAVLSSGNPEFVRKRLYIQPDGSLEPRMVLTPKGEEERDRLRQEAADRYSDLTRFAEEQGDRLASATYLLNLPILTASNVIQFGRLFSGGWKTNRANAVRGGLNISGDEITGTYRPKGTVWGRTVLNSLKVAGTESAEEMLQGVASSGTKEVARHRLSAFNDMGYDDEATHSVRSWFSDMYSGGVEYLADAKNWQEGFLGALTGLLGIPSRKFETWHGGVIGGYNDAKAEMNASRAAASDLYDKVNSKEFQDLWRGYIRHLKFDSDMGRATAEDNQYAWHTVDDAQLISDIMMFADAGRLDDLNQLVSHYGSLSAADAQGIREILKGDGKAADDFVKNASDSEVVERVKKQADRIKDTIKEYKEMYDALSSRAPMGASDEFLRELVFTAQQIRAFDRRFLQMLGETMTAIDPLLAGVSSVDFETGEARTEEDSKQRYEAVRDNYERIFAGTLVPVNLPKSMQKAVDDALGLLDELTKDDAELHAKVADMKRLSEDRREFYEKLRTLQEPKAQEKFDAEAVTQKKVEEAAEEAAVRQETNELDTLDKVKESYFKIINARERAQYADDLRRVEDSNPSVKKFLEIKRKYDAFRKYIEANPITSPDITVNYAMTYGLVDDLLRNAKNPEDFDALPDYMFPSEENFDARNTSILGLKSPTAYKNAIEAVRQSMREFLQLESDTATRKTISPQPLEFTPAPETVSEPTGRDAAQPGSLVPAPGADGDGKATEPKEVSVKFTGKAGDERTATYTIIERGGGLVARAKDGSNRLVVDVADLLDAGLSEKDFHADDGLDGSVFEDGRFSLHSITVGNRGSVALFGTLDGISVDIYEKDGADAKSALRAVAPELADALGISGESETETAERDRTDEGDTQVESEATPADAGIAEAAAYDDVPQGMQDERITPNGQHYQTPYYRTSVPEIETTEAKKARAALRRGYWQARSEADLSDFVLGHPEYAPVWNALEQRGAFRYTATKLRVGDEILLAIDPKFPKYQGEDQILVCTRDSNGKLQVLNTLSYQGNQYYGLYALRDRVKSEYEAFSKRNPDGVFVFSRKSRVWGLRGGLVDYDYSGKTENAVSQLAGHDEGSVVFLSRELEPITVVGDDSLVKDNRGVLDKVIARSKDEKNKEKPRKTRKGTLYFLSPTGKGAVPIALNVRHFNAENMETDTPTFTRIRESISTIADIVRETPTYVTPIEREFDDVVEEPVLDSEGKPVLDDDGKEKTTLKTEKVTRMETPEETNARYKELVDEQNRKLHEELRTLRQELDIHKWFFSIEDVEMHNDDGTVAGKQTMLRVNNGAAAAEAGEEQKSYLIRPDQSTEGQMLKFFAKLDCAVDVRLQSESKKNIGKEGSGNKTSESRAEVLKNFKNRVTALFNEGILTTNARKLHPKGTDFYFDAWDDSRQEFRPMTSAQMMLREEQDRREVEEQQIIEEQRLEDEGESVPVIHKDADDVIPSDEEYQDTDGFAGDSVEDDAPVNKPKPRILGRDTSTSPQESQDKAADESGQAEQQETEYEQKPEADRQLDEIVTKTFDELDAEGKKYLEEHGYSEEFYDSISPEARRKLWICMF